ncbi:MAG: HAD family hydrolase [Phycisphaerae bacterium]|nr:HAD family hydrolase [Phycisphaerae bacterium]
MLPEAILFDLDDTIMAYRSANTQTWAEVCRDAAAGCPTVTGEDLDQAIQAVRRWYWSDPQRHKAGRLSQDQAYRDIVALALDHLGNPQGLSAAAIADAFSRRRTELFALLPGAEATLERLASAGVKIALVTNGEAAKQRQKIARFGLERFFKAILIEEEVGIGKPDEAVFRRALDDLGVRGASAAWSVGDNLEWDVAGPQRVGIYSIWCDAARAGLPPGCTIRPDRIIRAIGELLE